MRSQSVFWIMPAFLQEAQEGEVLMAFVDVRFRITGDLLPADHGYLLFSAVSKIVPELHGDNAVGVHPVTGQLMGNRLIALTERSNLTIRLPADRIRQVLPLAGKTLPVAGYRILVGVPETRMLVPSARLYSRLVVIKGFQDPSSFVEAVQRQMDSLHSEGKAHLVEQPHVEESNRGRKEGSHAPFLRRTTRIRDKEVVGFALRVDQLTAEESVILQEKGIGGRRRFGCGVFVPDRW